MSDSDDDDLGRSSLARSAASGVRWTTLAGTITAGLGFLQTLVVARLLEPSDYGLMASVTVIISIGNAFADGGLASAVVVRETTRETLSSLYWLNLAVGVAVALVVFALAPVAGAFYDEPQLPALVRLASLVFVIGSLGQPISWMLQKELSFRVLGVIQIVSALAGTPVTIIAAARGAGVIALIAGMLVTTTVAALALMAVGWREWRPSLRFRARDLRGYLDFGLYQMGERSVNYLAANVDYILIGRFLGQSALGTYSVAYQLVVKPLFLINPMLTRVAFPIFAAARGDDQTLRRGYLHVVRLIAYVTLPLLLGITVVAPDFVEVVLGPKWAASADVLQVLCLVGILKSLTNPVGSVLLAKNRPDLGFKGNVVALVFMTAVLLVAVQESIMAVAWAYLAVTFVIYVAWLIVVHRLIHLRLGDYVEVVRPPTLFSLIMAACMAGLNLVTVAEPLITLLVVGALGGLVYIGLLARYEATYVRALWRLFRTRVSVAGAK